MDPNATYKEMMSMAEEALDLGGLLDNEEEAREMLSELAAHVTFLDQWIKGGGFLPKAWSKP